MSLKHILGPVSKTLDKPVDFFQDCIGEEAEQATKKLQPGEIILMENLRFYKEETDGDKLFAEKLSRLGDLYINDAFGTCHSCLLYTSPSPRDLSTSRMPSSA